MSFTTIERASPLPAPLAQPPPRPQLLPTHSKLRLIQTASPRKRTALRIRRQRIERAYLTATVLTAILLLLSSL